MQKKQQQESRGALLFMAGLGLVNVIGGVWFLTVPDDGSRGPRLPLTSTEGAYFCLAIGAALLIMAAWHKWKR